MDEYGSAFIDPCRPLIVLFGLSDYVQDARKSELLQRNGLKIESATPEVSEDVANYIWGLFQEYGGETTSSSGVDQANHQTQLYQFHRCGRRYQFATRKAVSQASPADMTPQDVTSLGATSLHSPLSPLSPGSPLYPDGIMSSTWIWKHRFMTPAMLISFHVLSSDVKLQSLHDNQLKQEVNSLRLQLDESHYKTKFGIVLLSEKSLSDDPALEDRLSTIRRATKLDAKSSFFFIQTSLNKDDLGSTIHVILRALEVPTTEYFKDLTRHARRKRDRIPSSSLVSTPSTPTIPTFSQSLGRHEWNARYEFKLGIFADFRREPDVAARHYNAALDCLFHPDGFFENVTNWSPRWNETRKFADVVAIRFIRCQLLKSLPSSAVMFWNHYRGKIHGILNRKGKGTSDYGWQAWQARWSTVMADLSNECAFPSGKVTAQKSQTTRDAASAPGNVFLRAEKQIQSDEALHPWHLLHHPGYWYKLAVTYTKVRRGLAARIPAEDRLPPGQSPAAAVARCSEVYDTYLCPDPPAEYENVEEGGSLHDKLLKSLIAQGMHQFSYRDQYRMANYLKLQLGKQLVVVKDDGEAHAKLKEAWKDKTWRREGWWELVRDAAISLHMSALKRADVDSQIATSWELAHSKIGPVEGFANDIMTLLERNSEEEHTVRLDASQIKSFMKVCCYFPKSRGHAGDLIQVRIIIQSSAHDQAQDTLLNQIFITLERSPVKLLITDNEASRTDRPESGCDFAENVSLSEDISENALWLGKANLTIVAGTTRVLDCQFIPRETGRIEAKSIKLMLKSGNFAIEHVTNGLAHLEASKLKDVERFLPGIRTLRSLPHQCEIMPKPPKLQINAVGMQKVYYLGEKATVTIQLANEETECINATIQARLLDGKENSSETHWTNNEKAETSSTLVEWSIGTLEARSSVNKTLTMQISSSPADVSIEIRAQYYLESDLNTPILKLKSFDAIIIQPFEATCDILPRFHPSIWPSFFSVPDPSSLAGSIKEKGTTEQRKEAFGITTRWSAQVSLHSLTTSPLTVSRITLQMDSFSTGCKSAIIEQDSLKEGESMGRAIPLSPRSTLEHGFVVDIQRADLDEQRTSSAAARLQVFWKRPECGDAETVHSLVELPRLSFDNGEPRVLATMTQPVQSEERTILIDFILENPTLHFLSFGIAMESSESYAFSGTKSNTMNLLPMSRRKLRYSFLPLKRGAWMQVNFKVVDLYFNKTLVVLAAEPLQSTGEGVQVWVTGESAIDAQY